MAWAKVQQATGDVDDRIITASLEDPPTPGNVMVAWFVTSNEISPADDGWVLAASDADFVSAYVYVRVVEEGDDGSITRILNAADETVWCLQEWSGTVFGTLDIVDQAVTNSPSENGAGDIAVGPTDSLEMPDELALALFGMSRTISTGTAVFELYGEGFSEEAQLGASTGDFPALAVVSKVIEDAVDPVSASAELTPNENRPLALLVTLRGLPPVDVRAFYSGGASNADPQQSTGGEISGTRVDWFEFPGDVSRLQGDTGLEVDYLIYYKVPEDSEYSAGLVVSVEDQLSEMTIEVGAPATGGTVSSDGVEFGEGPLDLGIKAPGETAPMWVRFTVPENATSIADDPFDVAVEVEPL